VKLRKLPSALT